MRRLAALALLWPAAALAEKAAAPPEPPDAEAQAEAEAFADMAEIPTEETVTVIERLPPGSAHVVGGEQLERFEQDDVHKVLRDVPGVYVRQEDGYGLRPNIGMRGTGTERSAKISLLEDGVLIAPAPYSAPAAYFFPLVTRMQAVEILKGMSSLRYGPSTVGGAINLVSRPVPQDREADVDVAGGSHLYGKLHGRVAEAGPRFGVLLEGVKIRSDGFKELDGGGSTGFDKNELHGKLRLQNAYDAPVHHRLELKLGWATEGSDETYTGLSDADFRATPYRRYAGTRLDRMDWDHLQLGLAYDLKIADVRVRLAAYRHTLDRAWRKLAGVGARGVEDVLAAPGSGNNAVYYAILTGASDSTSFDESLLLGTNDRRFLSQGMQATTQVAWTLGGLAQETDVGLRVHFDRARRLHTQDRYLMQGGAPAPMSDVPRETTLDASGSARALAGHLQHRVTAGPVQLVGVVRAEQIWNKWVDRRDPALSHAERYSVVLPGGGVVYEPLPWLGLLAGVHRGFVPVSAGPDSNVRPEESTNYETGARVSGEPGSVEVIGFLSDYANLKGTCTQSTGCRPEDLDREFDGGAVLVAGAEATAHADVKLGKGLRSPLRLAYTFTHSEFRSGFASENPQWGDVRRGDEMPYVPAHQVSLQAGVAGHTWDVAALAFLASPMRERPGQGDPLPGQETDATLTLDLAGSYGFGRWGTLYSTVTNVTGRAQLVSRLPYGARPGAPRLVTVGYRNHF